MIKYLAICLFTVQVYPNFITLNCYIDSPRKTVELFYKVENDNLFTEKSRTKKNKFKAQIKDITFSNDHYGTNFTIEIYLIGLNLIVVSDSENSEEFENGVISTNSDFLMNGFKMIYSKNDEQNLKQ